MKKLAFTLALGTLLTALPLATEAHNMTVDDMTLILREWGNGAQAQLKVGGPLDSAMAPFGGDYETTDEKFDFLRIVTYRNPRDNTTFIARSGKDDTRPAGELSVAAVNIMNDFIFLKNRLHCGKTYQDFVDKFGKPDRVTGHSNFNYGINDFPDPGPYYETYYYDLPGREFFFTTDNRKPNHPVVQFGYRTEV